MLQLRMTGKLQKEIGIKAESLSVITEADTVLGNWYLNLFTVDRRKAIIFVNEKTLFSFILYGVKKSNIGGLGDAFIAGLEQALAFEEIPGNIIKRLKLEYGLFQFTKTDSKKVIGNMNDLVSLYSHFIYCSGGLKSCDLARITMRINRTPQRNIDWDCSVNAIRALFGLEKSPNRFL